MMKKFNVSLVLLVFLFASAVVEARSVIKPMAIEDFASESFNNLMGEARFDAEGVALPAEQRAAILAAVLNPRFAASTTAMCVALRSYIFASPSKGQHPSVAMAHLARKRIDYVGNLLMRLRLIRHVDKTVVPVVTGVGHDHKVELFYRPC
jgi:hypothetical protein